MALMNRLNARAVATLGAGKYNDGGAQWLYRYTIHGRRREMDLGTLREVFLKQTRETATRWRSVLHEGRDPIKEREKQKREAMRNLHYLNDIALDAFESRKAELKDDGKDGRLVFIFTTSCLSQIMLPSHFRNHTNRDTQYACPHMAYKSRNSRKSAKPS